MPPQSTTSYFHPRTLPFWGLHVVALAGVFYTGWSWRGAALAVVTYFVRMIVVTAGYHRYFAHRTFKTSRAFQFLLALAAQSSAQKGALWWASHHRYHHKHSDDALDPHSAKRRGFWHAHLGWILGRDWQDTKLELVGDLAKYPELRFLNRPSVQLLPALVLAIACLALGGVHGLVWGFFVSTVLLWHGTFSINSLSHMFGRRRFDTTDESRNNLLLALITTGEGWHNNHHHYQSSARQGFRWWEIDVTYYVLRFLAAVGLVWDLRPVPPAVMAQSSAPASATLEGA
jgi:stearoyl-CoA desaturase (delta-9 desaturase)